VGLKGFAAALAAASVFAVVVVAGAQAGTPAAGASWNFPEPAPTTARAPWGTTTDGAAPPQTRFAQDLVGRQLHGDARLDAIANDIVGTNDMVVALEDDPFEWSSFLGFDSEDVLGFVVFQQAPSPLYHAVLLSPQEYPTWTSWLATGTPVGNEAQFAMAAMTLIHESYHWKLLSGDESAVNACALRDFGYYIARDFGVSATVTHTTTEQVATRVTKRVLVTKFVVKKKRVKIHGKWVIRSVRQRVKAYVKKTVTVSVPRTVETTVANPLYDTLVSDARAFYDSQPPPYNAGSCPAVLPAGGATPSAPAYHVRSCWVQYTGGSWGSVNQGLATTSLSGTDILTRGASNFWSIVNLDAPPTAAFAGTTISLIQPNGATFFAQPLSQAWPTTASEWEADLGWHWSDNTLFFQHPERTGSGTWTLRWTFPDGQVCNSAFTVS
jgi:hypothetical protein